MDIKEYLESEEHVCYSWAKEIARWFDYCVDRIDEKNKKIGYRKFSLTGWNLVHFNHRTNKIELSCEYKDNDTDIIYSFNESWKVKKYGHFKGFLGKVMYQYLKENFDEHEDFRNSSVYFGSYNTGTKY